MHTRVSATVFRPLSHRSAAAWLRRAHSSSGKLPAPAVQALYPVPAAWVESRAGLGALAPASSVIASPAAFAAAHAASVADPAGYWRSVAKGFEWRGLPLGQTGLAFNFDRTKGRVFSEWFKGSTTNLAFNALDRQVALGRGAHVAMACERSDPAEPRAPHQPSTYTYSELTAEVNRLANALKGLGVKKGDTVGIFMAHCPEASIAMLACARLGAVHCVVFGGFSKEALAQRLVDAKATVVVTQDGVMRGGKLVALKRILDDAAPLVEKAGGKVAASVVLQRLGERGGCRASHAMLDERDRWWHDLVPAQSAACESEWVDAEAPSFILYTSGSTGKPKGIVHSTGGYMLGAAASFASTFDCRPNERFTGAGGGKAEPGGGGGDVFFCTADCGWITGHTYVTYGPLLCGASQVVFEGVPTWPTASRIWEIVDKHQVTHLYTAPTLIRSLMGAGDRFVASTSRASLRLLGTVGEPINPEAWRWFFEVAGRSKCPVVDTYWQTETGSHALTPHPIGGLGQKPGAASTPCVGVQAVLLDAATGSVVEGSPAEGLLAIAAPWPSALRGVHGDYDRFEQTYFSFPGYYLTGDNARRDGDGHYWVTGRADDVVIVSGHNVGTAEVESAVVLHPLVAEAAVVGVDHAVKGQALYVFVALKDAAARDPALDRAGLDAALRDLVRAHVGAFASPDAFHYCPTGVPKTRSGKIMRRILRKVAILGPAVTASDLGDTSTLADPSVVADLIASHAKSAAAAASPSKAK